ncbi:MAG: imidazolonepropionase, partial [Bacteroidota bacterium]
MKLLIKNIRQLIGVHDLETEKVSGENMARLPFINNAWLAAENGRIVDFGKMENFPGITDWSFLEVIDASGKTVMPSFCDSHTHLVFAGSREDEFVDKIRGLTYSEIAKRGGGILNSAKKIAAASEDELFESAKSRLFEVIKQGTGAI